MGRTHADRFTVVIAIVFTAITALLVTSHVWRFDRCAESEAGRVRATGLRNVGELEVCDGSEWQPYRVRLR